MTIPPALRGLRDRIMVSGHLGSTLQEGTYTRTRELRLCEASLHDLLTRLHTDHVDVLVLHFVDRADDYASQVTPLGILKTPNRIAF